MTLLAAVVTDWTFGYPTVQVAEARGSAPTWVYRFDHPDPATNHGYGAAHAVEIPFVFDAVGRADAEPLLGPDPSQDVAETVHGLWVAFVTGGDPGWAPYTAQQRTVAVLDETITPVEDPAADERLLWA